MKKYLVLLSLPVVVALAKPADSLTNMGGLLVQYEIINKAQRDNEKTRIRLTKDTELALYEALYRIKQRNALMLNFKKVESVNKERR